MMEIFPELLGVLLTMLICSPFQGCTPQQATQVHDTTDRVLETAHQLCLSRMRLEPIVQLAAERVGKPLDQYVTEACRSVDVVDPVVRVATDLAHCPAPPQAVAPPAGVAGSPGQ